MNSELRKTRKETARDIWETIKFIALAALIVIPIRLYVFQPFIVSGESMYPTYQNTDYLIIDELSYRFNEPKRGDVIVFRYPNDPSRFFIKRIIGLPGDTLLFKDRAVYLKTDTNPNGELINEPYLKQITIPGGQSQVTVDPEHYFVMGDNRGASSDSRAWGQLPRKNIIGIAGLRLLPISDIAWRPGSLAKFTTTESK
jgi:signal peptidase I